VPWLAELIDRYDIGLAISINDFELSTWASLIGRRPEFSVLQTLRKHDQEVIEDKLLLASRLASFGLLSPPTMVWEGRGAVSGSEIPWSEIVIKGRFGSGSRGLWIGATSELPSRDQGREVEYTDAVGRTLESGGAVLQKCVSGVEYGLDVICDFSGAYAGVLARQKLSMRAGETDRAVTVNVGQFEDVSKRIAVSVPHAGTMDVDVIVDADDRVWVLDINPRFGGGYPFSHMAGANLPACYVAWSRGAVTEQTWLHQRPGIYSAKSVGIELTGLPA
jgi:carbamoyl-phosphate synthase large subunit